MVSYWLRRIIFSKSTTNIDLFRSICYVNVLYVCEKGKSDLAQPTSMVYKINTNEIKIKTSFIYGFITKFDNHQRLDCLRQQFIFSDIERLIIGE